MQRLRLWSLAPVAGLVLLSVLAFLDQKAVNRAHENRLVSDRLAGELRRSSDELTRLARTYVVTADPDYERQYWDVLAVRNGTAPRPDGRTVPLRTLMERQGFTAAEFAALQRAEDNSNALVTTETIAMNAVKGLFADGRGGYTRQGEADPAMARRIMHDARYHADKESIMGPIREFEQLLDHRTAATVASARRRSDLMVLLILLLAVGAVASVWLAIRGHARGVRRAIDELAATAGNVGSGSRQVADASIALARGTAEQVAAVEDVATAARTTGSMAADNARRARSAGELVAGEQRQVVVATGLLAELRAAIEQVNDAGGRISTINKTIDEIAFQTNILALNAAVEAARAGEAGLGFAVVADEVRNLAQRSARAAKETAVLIAEATSRTEAGCRKMGAVTAAIDELAGQSSAVRSLVDEVQAGSGDQQRAVERVKAGLEQITDVTQSAAAAAEEGSAAAEELSAQAAVLLDVVASLERMVGRTGGPADAQI